MSKIDALTPANLSKDFAQKRIVYLYREMLEAAKMAKLGTITLIVHGSDVDVLNSEYKVEEGSYISPITGEESKYKIASHKELEITFFD